MYEAFLIHCSKAIEQFLGECIFTPLAKLQQGHTRKWLHLLYTYGKSNPSLRHDEQTFIHWATPLPLTLVETDPLLDRGENAPITTSD